MIHMRKYYVCQIRRRYSTSLCCPHHFLIIDEEWGAMEMHIPTESRSIKAIKIAGVKPPSAIKAIYQCSVVSSKDFPLNQSIVKKIIIIQHRQVRIRRSKKLRKRVTECVRKFTAIVMKIHGDFMYISFKSARQIACVVM